MQVTIELRDQIKIGKQGISNVIVVMLSLVLIVIIVGNVILWNFQMNQIDWERGQERIEITNVIFASSNNIQIILKNTGPLLAHIVAVWISDSSTHQRVTKDTYLDLGQTLIYDVNFALTIDSTYTIRVITERGNIAVCSETFILGNGGMIAH